MEVLKRREQMSQNDTIAFGQSLPNTHSLSHCPAATLVHHLGSLTHMQSHIQTCACTNTLLIWLRSNIQMKSVRTLGRKLICIKKKKL